MNSSAGNSQANPFIKIIEQEFMHEIDSEYRDENFAATSSCILYICKNFCSGSE